MCMKYKYEQMVKKHEKKFEIYEYMINNDEIKLEDEIKALFDVSTFDTMPDAIRRYWIDTIHATYSSLGEDSSGICIRVCLRVDERVSKWMEEQHELAIK